MKRFYLFFLATILLYGCTGNDGAASALLDEAAKNIESNPKFSLNLLDSIKHNELHNQQLRARYSLLKSMALDKNYIDITSDSLISVALKYYSRKGSDIEQTLAYFYLGRVYKNAGNYNNAIIEYTKAEQIAPKYGYNKIIGRLYMGIADIYNINKNHIKEIEYVNKGYEKFKLAESENDCNLSLGRLAMAYSSLKEWKMADSLYTRCITLCSKDSAIMPIFLSAYARTKLLKQEKEPQEAISLLNRKYYEYGKMLSTKDYYAYAYSLALLGKNKECDAILDRLKGSKNREFEYWMYLIDYHRQYHRDAITYLNKSYAQLDKDIENYLSNSLERSIGEYYKQQQYLDKINSRTQILQLVIFSLSIIIISCIVLLSLILKNKKKRQEIKTYLKLTEEMARQVKLYESQLSSQSSIIANLQKDFIEIYKKQYHTLGELCMTYLTKQQKKDAQNAIYKKVEHIISIISSEEKLHSQLENKINKELDNIVTNLKKDLPSLTNEEIRFACYCFIGFDATLIATIFNLSLQNVYTKKSRLKSKILALASPHKDKYLSMI